ncbi:DEAD/DEAH box helicase family protein [Synechococcus sp. ATX 2A4]|uniref:DEAD/DEAH box helicase n=1 Tax=Synechococcus sp. ATX 2A4 TaxID=2823727 RepID=UPI0020CBBCF7|nr:DEAD/DEAH box helicase family protein [Synechococcus sp. ATX 2A4]
MNTLVLMHRAELLRQWQERLQTFLDVPPEAIGPIGGGKTRPTGRLDIAVMQSLVRKGEVNPVVQNDGQVIVDECHHFAAASFETILRLVKARYVLGLSATLVRRDGLQPILFMQCGPIRHTAERPAGGPQTLELVSRTERIVAEDLACWGAGRKLLWLSERTGHITAIAAAHASAAPPWPRWKHCRRRRPASRWTSCCWQCPVSWKGTLQQYAGRLHRHQTGKTSVRIIDWLDLGHPEPQRKWERRLRGYRATG